MVDYVAKYTFSEFKQAAKASRIAKRIFPKGRVYLIKHNVDKWTDAPWHVVIEHYYG